MYERVDILGASLSRTRRQINLEGMGKQICFQYYLRSSRGAQVKTNPNAHTTSERLRA